MTCIPLHKIKENKRGFNQSNLIAGKLAKELRLPYCSNLAVRKINTKPQAKLNRSGRLVNLKNVFKANKNFDLKGMNILIFDDVATTLSTLNECAFAMKKAGAKKVWGMTVARG